MQKLLDFIKQKPLACFAGCAAMITVWRIILLFSSDLNLGPDETQYWYWSKSLEFGYFSKPPLIAWIIALSTSLFGNAEWAVRLTSPLFHLGTACFLFALGSHLYNRVIGFWVGTGWLLLPGIAFSSMLITTDVPLLFLWTGALFLFARLVIESKPGFDEPSIGLAGLFGLFIGLGFLAKYAMIYFLIAMGVTLIVTGAWRRKRVWQSLAMALVIAAIIIAPNIAWNSAHDFQTLSHTASNANWSKNLFHPEELGDFLIGQIAIAGPVLLFAFFLSLIPALNRTGLSTKPSQSKPGKSDPVRLLIAFALTPIIIVSIQAILSRAHANWGATSYPALIVLASAWLYFARHRLWLVASHGFNLFVAFVLSIGLSNFAWVDLAGFSNAIKRVRGWDVQGPVIEQMAKNYPVIMADDRELTGQLLYYANLSDRGIRAFDSNNHVDSHYEAFHPFNPSEANTLLYVTQNADAIAVTPLFDIVKPLGQTSIDLKRGRTRTLYMFEISGFRGR